MRVIVMLVLLSLPAVAQSKPVSPPESIPAQGTFFALSVPDLRASVDWYVQKLGLRVTTGPNRDGKFSFAILEGDGLIVELIQNDDAQPLAKHAPGLKDNVYVHGIFKTGIIVKDFERTLALFKERKIEIAYGPYAAKKGQRANVIVKDNAGNLIQFFGPSAPTDQ